MSYKGRPRFWTPPKQTFKDETVRPLRSLCKPSHRRRWRIGPDEKIPAGADIESYWICDECHPAPSKA